MDLLEAEKDHHQTHDMFFNTGRAFSIKKKFHFSTY